VGPATFYAAHNARNGRVILDPNSPQPASQLKFNGFSLSPLWTSTVAGEGEVYIKRWSPPDSTYTVKVTDKGTATDYAGVFCVRSLEPDLLQLAKDAHPPTAVTGVPQLQSIALLVKAEDALATDQFDEAITQGKQALALDPNSIRAFDDIGMANAYAGNWPDAIAALNKAVSLDKHHETSAKQDLANAKQMLKNKQKGK
jgi:tetratricopeptide (TPR) repeat protein